MNDSHKIQARRPKKQFLLPPFVAQKMNPRSPREFGHGLLFLLGCIDHQLLFLLGCRSSALDRVTDKKPFLAMLEKKGQKPGKVLPFVWLPDRNRSGVVDLVGYRIACCSRKLRTAWQNFRRKKRKTHFLPKTCHFLEEDRSLFARVEIVVTEIPKDIRKRKKNALKLLRAETKQKQPFLMGNFQFFGRGKDNQNWLTSVHPRAYTSMPQHPQKTSVILKKGGQIKIAS